MIKISTQSSLRFSVIIHENSSALNLVCFFKTFPLHAINYVSLQSHYIKSTPLAKYLITMNFKKPILS